MLFSAAHALGILLVNAIPLAGVLWFGWNVFEVLFLYWVENVAIGVAHTVRLAVSTRTNGESSAFSTTWFFAMHYGMFTLVHGVFVVVLFGVLGDGLRQLSAGFAGPVLAIIAWQAILLVIDTQRTDRFRGRPPGDMMFEPYPRVFALHLTVLAGGWLIGELGAPVWALAILVGVKTLFDLGVVALDTLRAGESAGTIAALRKRRD
jgi:hypothetical protein